MRTLNVLILCVVVSVLVACGSNVLPSNGETNQGDVVADNGFDPLDNLVPCTSHKECAPFYCVGGYCNGTPDPVDDVTEEVAPEVVNNDIKEETTTEVADNDNGSETSTDKCHSDSDCDDGNVCTTEHCQWGECYHEQYECKTENMACYESATGIPACAYTCEVESDCQVPGQCYDSECVNGFCQFSPNNGRECNDDNPCTINDYCLIGECAGGPKCKDGECHDGACKAECQNDLDCAGANDPCRDDECVFGTCVKQTKGECCSIFSDTCTDDNNPCTSTACVDNGCVFVADNNAICEVGGLPGRCDSSYCWNDTPEGECIDNDPCTNDTENDDHTECIHNLVCADGDYCTEDLCVATANGGHTCVFQQKNECCHVDSDCNDNDNCTKDFCNGATCEHDKLCLDGEPKMLVCEYDSDCTGSGFGDYCVASGEPGTPLKLCQECSGGGEQNECFPWEMCFWGLGGNGNQMYSVFWCEDVVCENATDCNDNDPCTQDLCGVSECYHNPKEHCTKCTDDSECPVQSWCDNSGGGVLIQYANCEASGACQLDSWDNTVDVTLYGCEYPLPCENDADCPRIGGECMIGTCYYYDATSYPECAVDDQCFGTGACDFGNGKCVDYECYAIDNGEGSLSVKLCPENQACVNHECKPNVIVISGCTQDADCLAMGEGAYCNSNPVTGKNICSPCSTSQFFPEGMALGCPGLNSPFCVWNGTTQNFGCVQCNADSHCGFGNKCIGNVCSQTEDITCQVSCPTANPPWKEAVIWYGTNEDATVTCGDSFSMTKYSLCQWGTPYPEFKLNLTDGVWSWGGGVDVILICNYGSPIRPDPTPSGTPGQTMGDLGVAIVDFTSILCDN